MGATNRAFVPGRNAEDDIRHTLNQQVQQEAHRHTMRRTLDAIEERLATRPAGGAPPVPPLGATQIRNYGTQQVNNTIAAARVQRDLRALRQERLNADGQEHQAGTLDRTPSQD